MYKLPKFQFAIITSVEETKVDNGPAFLNTSDFLSAKASLEDGTAVTLSVDSWVEPYHYDHTDRPSLAHNGFDLRGAIDGVYKPYAWPCMGEVVLVHIEAGKVLRWTWTPLVLTTDAGQPLLEKPNYESRGIEYPGLHSLHEVSGLTQEDLVVLDSCGTQLFPQGTLYVGHHLDKWLRDNRGLPKNMMVCRYDSDTHRVVLVDTLSR